MWQPQEVKGPLFTLGTSLTVLMLRLHVSNAEGMGSIPSQGTKILRVCSATEKLKLKNEMNRAAVPWLISSETSHMEHESDWLSPRRAWESY